MQQHEQAQQVRGRTGQQEQEGPNSGLPAGVPSPGKNYNRLHVVLAHTSRYAFEPQARLAKDVGVSRSTISRLMSGNSQPSFDLVRRITAALEKALDLPLDPRELFSPDGTYPTASGCRLCGCQGCMPEEAHDRWGRLRPAFQNQKPGDWALSPTVPQPPAQ